MWRTYGAHVRRVDYPALTRWARIVPRLRRWAGNTVVVDRVCTGAQARVPVPLYTLAMELTRVQMETLERLFQAGFRPIAIPPYENALCVHRGECVAVLAAVENGGLQLRAPATLMVDGNFSVRLKKPGGDVFVWKKTEVAATEARVAELEKFREELVEILGSRRL